MADGDVDGGKTEWYMKSGWECGEVLGIKEC